METMHTPQARLAQFPTWCHAAGLKVTRQRLAIYEMLATSAAHPTADEVYAAVQHRMPHVSLGTVYKILDLFHLHGLVRKVPTDGPAARYDARLDAHHHLVCERCGRIQDVVLPPMPSSHTDVPAESGFHAEAYELLIRGVCAACRGAQPAGRAPSPTGAAQA